jgi:hypothetical protein
MNSTAAAYKPVQGFAAVRINLLHCIMLKHSHNTEYVQRKAHTAVLKAGLTCY